MAINIDKANLVILQQLISKGILTNTIYTKKSTGFGRIGQSVDVQIDSLKDVAVRDYTEADKASNAPYIYDQYSLDTINVRLGEEIYAALEVDGWDNLEINAENIGDYAPIINTLSTRVKTRIETAIGTLINGLTGLNVKTVEYVGATRAEKGREVITALQEANFDMNTNGVPAEDRFAVLGREAYLNVLATNELLHASKAGEETPQALRKAIVGEVAGFVVIPSDAVDSDSAAVYQKEAFGLISRAPGKHVAAPYSELAQLEGAPIDLRVNVDGLADQNSTGVIVSTFFAVKELVEEGATSNPRAKKIVFTNLV